MSEQLNLFDSHGYNLSEKSDGFLISAIDRNPVTVSLQPACLEISYRHRDRGTGAIVPVTYQFNFFDYYGLSRSIAAGMMHFWERPKNYQLKDGHEPQWLRHWAIKQTAKSVGKRVHKQWQRLLAQVDPEVLATHKAVFVACGMNPESDFIYNPAIYEHSYIARDIQKYRGAAIMAGTDQNNLFGHYIGLYLEAVQTDSYTEKIKILNRIRERAPEALIEKWDYWPVLYSDTGDLYTSLQRTLFNLPGNIPAGALTNLGNVHLPRPITNRRELLLVLAIPECVRKNNTSIFQQATTAQIKTAIKRLSAHLRLDLSADKYTDIRRLARFVTDYPEPHSGNLVGLTDTAIRWHRHEQDKEREKLLTKYEGCTRLAQPPVALPPQPEIRLIATVDDLKQESIQMSHCIASYADLAISGECYLFHVDYRGEQATIQLDPGGEIVQASGPQNGHNQAVKWGKRQLKRWGDSIPSGTRPMLFSPELRQTQLKTIELGPLFGGFDIQTGEAD